MMSTKRRYQFLYLLLYASANGIAGFRNVFFADIGLSESQMGIIGSVLVASGIVAQPIWGFLADAYGKTKVVLLVGTVVSVLGGLIFPFGMVLESPFLLMVLAAIVYSVFRSPLIPLANAMVLSAGIDYGNVRAFGSVAFGIGILAMGPIVSEFGTVSIFIVHAIGMAVVVVSLRGVPSPPSADLSPDLRRDTIQLLTNGRFLLLLVVAMLVGAATSTGNAFFSVYIRAIGQSDTMTGVAWFLRTLAEAAVFVWAIKLGLGHRFELSIGALVSGLSFLVYVVAPSFPFVFLAQIPRGVGFAFFTLAAVSLAYEYTPESLNASSQTVLAAIGMGTGRVLGQVVGGRIADVFGVTELFLYLAAASLLGALFSLALFVEFPSRPAVVGQWRS